MPRGPKGKCIRSDSGSFSVAAKNQNGSGSVYFEPATTRMDGTVIAVRWRATYVDADGKRRRVTAPTRALVEQRRDEALEVVRRVPLSTSRFTRATTVSELSTWWLETVARHQVKISTLDSYRKFVGYLSADIGELKVVDVGAEILTVWQSNLLDRYAPTRFSTVARSVGKCSRRQSRSVL